MPILARIYPTCCLDFGSLPSSVAPVSLSCIVDSQRPSVPNDLNPNGNGNSSYLPLSEEMIVGLANNRAGLLTNDIYRDRRWGAKHWHSDGRHLSHNGTLHFFLLFLTKNTRGTSVSGEFINSFPTGRPSLYGGKRSLPVFGSVTNQNLLAVIDWPRCSNNDFIAHKVKVCILLAQVLSS